jgi:hypothetical protein
VIGDAPKPVAPKIVYPMKMTSAAMISVSSEIGPSRQRDFRRCGRTVNFAIVTGTTLLVTGSLQQCRMVRLESPR